MYTRQMGLDTRSTYYLYYLLPIAGLLLRDCMPSLVCKPLAREGWGANKLHTYTHFTVILQMKDQSIATRGSSRES